MRWIDAGSSYIMSMAVAHVLSTLLGLYWGSLYLTNVEGKRQGAICFHYRLTQFHETLY